MKAKILIGVICFIVGAGAYYLYENNFSHSSKVEKCANKKYYGYYFRIQNQSAQIKEYYRYQLPNFLKKSYADKVRNDITYRNDAEFCEDYAKKYPDIFKKQY